MGEKKNFAALDWVIGEIEDTLNDARSALESYVENPQDSTKMRFCLTHIHQVYGSLQMVEFHGASLLAEEIEHLAQAIMNNTVGTAPEAQEVLMRSMLQLPVYLEHVKNTKDDNPAVILPLLNDLRAVRKQSLLSETNLFLPDLSPLKTVRGTRQKLCADRIKLAEVLKKLREMYQLAAANVLREIKLDLNLTYLIKVSARMEWLTSGTACQPLWEVSSAMLEALSRGDLRLCVAVRGLLRLLARELRILGEKAPGALDMQPRESLIKNLLYYVARAKSGGKKVDLVKSKYNLAESIRRTGDAEESSSMTVPDPDAIRSVVVALLDEINTIKHILDLSLSGQSSAGDLKNVLPVVKRVADTLAVLGIGDLRKRVLAQADALEELSNQNELDGEQLMEVANKVIEIENRLGAISKVAGKNQDYDNINERDIEIDQAKYTLIKECNRGLEQTKDAIVEYISSQWNKERLGSVNALLTDIRGGLDMIPLPRPRAVLASCNRYVQEELMVNEGHPEWRSLDALADAIASIEYYLERLTQDFDEDLDSLLEVAEESVEQLGYPVSKPEEPLTLPAESLEPVEALQAMESANERAPAAEVVVEEVEVDVNVDVDVDVVRADEMAVPVAQAEEVIADIHVAQPPSLESAENLEETAANSVEPTTPSEISLEDIDEDDGIDDEIIEIFIEEAGEVSETLAEHFPRWQQNSNDKESLVVIRRAFHTLKGSGRMVEARVIGELAWSVENMLNRVLDSSVPNSPAQANLIVLVLKLLPELITAFENRAGNPAPALTEQYTAWADALSEGEEPAELMEAPSLSETPTEFPGDNQLEIEIEVAQSDTEESDVDEEDEVLWEIFSSESEGHLETMETFIAQMEEAAPAYAPPTDELQRAMHTLKGSARMAQITPIAALVEPLESFAKELISYQVNIDADILQLIRDSVDYIREGLTRLVPGREFTIPKTAQFLARTGELRDLAVGHLIRLKELEKQGENKVDPHLLSIFMAEEMKLLLDADELILVWKREGIESVELPNIVKELSLLEKGAERANLPDMAQLSRLLRSIHEAALQNNIVTDEPFFSAVSRGHENLLDMVDAVAAGQNLAALEDGALSELMAIESAVRQERISSPEEDDGQAHEIPADTSLETQQPEVSSDTRPVETIEIEAIPAEDMEASGENVEVAIEIGNTDEFVLVDDFAVDAQSGSDAEKPDGVEENDPSLSEFELREASVDAEEYTSDTQQDQSEEGVLQVSELQGAEVAADGEVLPTEPETEREVTSDRTPLIETPDLTEVAEADNAASGIAESREMDPVENATEPVMAEAIQSPVSDEAGSVNAGVINGLLDKLDVSDEDFDEGIMEVFLEEANELVEELDEAVHTWETDWANVDCVEQIKRALHTLKGGARLSGMLNLGELAHEYEGYLESADIADVDGAFFSALHEFQDRTLRGIRAIQTFMSADMQIALPGNDLMAEVPAASGAQIVEPAAEVEDELATGTESELTVDVEESASSANELETAPEESGSAPEKEVDTNILPFTSKPSKPRFIPPAPLSGNDGDREFVMPQAKHGGGGGGNAAANVAARKAAPQEVIKVSAELLEELVNLAGETSIGRGRLEQQVNDFGLALEEIDATIERLQEQLRRLDIETEAQILFRQEQIAEHEKDFDPLEMDRYSALQQLSRSLIESASDLFDLKSTMSDKIRDTETLLLQQSRVNTTLQEGLMRSRMVPFSRMVPRLRRIVRQVATELGKQVSFELDNVEGELDRSVLERMVAPLEHMLRNAVDHGIEMPEDRIAAGKVESGRIVLTLGREGGDVILRLADDGRGIDLKRVREKAIERGLITNESNLTDHDVMQFILHAGFSTAESVTQISGRGVGMDVVYAEIKQLGGTVSINSAWGKGTEFFVRLPFTVSVNRALMVEIGGDRFAVPLNTIEGIVRVSPFELEHYYTEPDTRFEYAGEKYLVRYMGSLLSQDFRPRLEGKALPIPVLLVRSAEHAMALQVDALMGSREIVVKGLGQQFSAVQGLSGATVMGDGSVVVILDPHALVRKEMAFSASRTTLLEAPEIVEDDAIKTVMVVDDSVTVRKVTSRFLEREGFEVITAKDGVDALAVLQETIPDIMLLDIEMPRMDGFEVAKNVRGTRRWKGIPIIMITSRTGDKHRDHALSLGVNRYLGKPYQEEVLLESLNELLAESESKS